MHVRFDMYGKVLFSIHISRALAGTSPLPNGAN